MALPANFTKNLSLPVIASPLFIISNPDLVIAQCTSGIIGSFPSLNARSLAQLDEWLAKINEALTKWDTENPGKPAAPFAVNQIIHKTNARWEKDLELCEKYKVPMIISSLGANVDLNKTVQAYGGVTFHDVINNKFAQKAIDKGATGLIPVAAGAGGHAGKLSPFALMQEIREWFDGPVALSGSIACGKSILAAQAMGADFAYIGSPFIATKEAQASDAYKQAIIDASADDIIYSDLFTGVHGNYLAASIKAAGLDPDTLHEIDAPEMNWKSGGDSGAKVWKDIWGCGQGIGVIKEIAPTHELVQKFKAEYKEAILSLSVKVPSIMGGN